MTSKKFRLTATAVALAACAAAQPLRANAVGDLPEEEKNQDAAVQPEEETMEQPENVTGQEPAEQPEAAVVPDEETVPEEKEETVPEAQEPAGDTGDPDSTPEKAEELQQSGPVSALDPKDKVEYQEPEIKEGPDGSLTETKEGTVTDADGNEKGTAEKTESRTDTSSTEYDPTEKLVDQTTEKKPDGSADVTKTTVRQGTTTDNTEVSGSASASTSQTTTTPKDQLDAETELKDLNIDWKTEKGDAVGNGFTVTGKNTSDDGNSNRLELTRTTTESGPMEAEDIAKLLEAGYTQNADGTYTLTKTVTDANGNQQQTTVTVDASKATRTTTTILQIRVDKSTHTGHQDTEQEFVYPPKTTLTDDEGNTYELDVNELLKNAARNEDGSYTLTEGDKTYTLTPGAESEEVANLTNQQLVDLLGGTEKGYTLKNGEIWLTTVDGEDCRLTVDQTNLLRKTLQMTVSVKNSKGTTAGEQVTGEKTPEQAEAEAKQKAQEKALLDAVRKTAGVDVAFADLTQNENGSYTYTDSTGKTYTYTVSVNGTVTNIYQKTENSGNDRIEESGTHTVIGSAAVNNCILAWTKNGQSYFQSSADSPLTGDLGAPTDATDVQHDAEGRVTEYTIVKDGKTKVYHFRYDEAAKLTDAEKETYALQKLAEEKGMTVEQLQQAGYSVASTNYQGLTRISWDVYDRETVTDQDTNKTETLPEIIAANCDWTITPDSRDETEDQTYTIVWGNRTYTGLTKNGDTYTSEVTDENGHKTTTTITVTRNENLSDAQLSALLREKLNLPENTSFTFDRTGNTVKAEYAMNGTAYRVDCTGLLEQTLDVETQEEYSLTETGKVEDKDNNNIDDVAEELWKKIEEIRKNLKDDQTLFIGDMEIKSDTQKEDIIQKITTVVSLNNVSKEQLIENLKKQEYIAKNIPITIVHTATGGWSETRENFYSGEDSKDRKDYMGHLELISGSRLTLRPDASGNSNVTTCVISPRDLKLEWNYDAEKLIDDIDNTEVDLWKEEIGCGYNYNYTTSFDKSKNTLYDKAVNNGPTASAFYRVTGYVAYNAILDASGKEKHFSYEEAIAAYREAKGYAENYEIPEAELQERIIRLGDKSWYNNPNQHWYQVYTDSAKLSAYGYLDLSSNRCRNITKREGYINLDWVGCYDLELSNLIQVENGEIVGQSQSTIKTYVAPLRIVTKDKVTRNTAELKQADGWQQQGSYDAGYEQKLAPQVTADGESSYTTETPWEETTAETTVSGTRLGGWLDWLWRSEKDPEITLDGDKTEQTGTEGSVQYHYEVTSQKDAPPLVTTTTVNVPGAPDVPETPMAPMVKDETAPEEEQPAAAVEQQEQTEEAAPAELSTAEDSAKNSVEQTVKPGSTLIQTGVDRTAPALFAAVGSYLLALGAFLNHRKRNG